MPSVTGDINLCVLRMVGMLTDRGRRSVEAFQSANMLLETANLERHNDKATAGHARWHRRHGRDPIVQYKFRVSSLAALRISRFHSLQAGLGPHHAPKPDLRLGNLPTQ